MKKITQLEWAYLAGILDGEGTISIFTSRNSTKGRKYPCYCPRVSISNCDERIMIWLEKTIGGRARPVKRKRETNSRKWRQSYIWELSRKQAVPILKNILPYLIIKRAQAALFLRFRETGQHRGSKLSLGIVHARQRIIDEMQFLNRKGPRIVRVA
jgi:hypothetical protein